MSSTATPCTSTSARCPLAATHRVARLLGNREHRGVEPRRERVRVPGRRLERAPRVVFGRHERGPDSTLGSDRATSAADRGGIGRVRVQDVRPTSRGDDDGAAPPSARRARRAPRGRCTDTPSASSSGTRWSFHGSRYTTSMSNRSRSCAPAAATSKRSAPPGPRPLTSHNTRVLSLTIWRRPEVVPDRPRSGRIRSSELRESSRLFVIISHEHRFIFVKTRKTAGTSIEVLFDPLAGDDAVVTPDRSARGRAPTRGTTSFPRPRPARSCGAFGAAVRGKNNAGVLQPHLRVGIRTQLGKRRFDSYFTFCFERNPWDKVVSGYFFAKGRGQFDGSLRDYVLHGDLPSRLRQVLRGRQTVGVDFVGRYEHLEDDLRQRVRSHRLGASRSSLTREKGNYRPADARRRRALRRRDEPPRRIGVRTRDTRVRLHADRRADDPRHGRHARIDLIDGVTID